MAYSIALVSAVLGCGLVTGLLLAFAVVAMPGIAVLDDRAFVRAFQVMDQVIQDRQPVFMLLWAGSLVAALAAAGFGWGHTTGSERVLVLGATALWIGGLQVPTALVNIPLNNRIQALDVAGADDAAVRQARTAFEARWNTWNQIRTAAGAFATLGFALLLLAR